MSTNMLSGERRWASARRGGMTVLGKVAVPKPLNLPSQRLENHGLDPSVEIVPKGTLGWGSRPSSSGSNAWISSSSNADGGNTSPSHLSGRPSSGGTGTRPSTAGSDRTHEPVASVWSSNSRPSSASGALASNQSSSTSLRPRSAETRPNSSQLSRFAEPVSESSVSWGPSSAAERLGVKSSKNDEFSLTSGDFPTLGSDKDNTMKNFESQDHSRPSSASGRITSSNEDAKYQADPNCGVVNTWRADESQMEENGFHPSNEKWQGERQKYFNPSVAPQHFDAWRGPPVNAQPGVWYHGRPRGPAFGAPGVSGGYPMEPFPYYRPQIPPPALGGPQPVPPHGGGPRGTHPQNGDLYRPHMANSYARPGMPFRLGFYPGPPGAPGPMSYEGYYGPPMGYFNNERDMPYMGMPAAPPVYSCNPGANGPPDTVHGRAGGHAVTGKTMPEHMESDHLEGGLGPKRVSLKSYNERGRKEEGENWEHSVQPSVSHPGKSILPMITSRNNEWGADDDDDDAERDISAKRTISSENSSRSLSYRDHYSDSVNVESFGGTHSVNVDDGGWTNKSRSLTTFPPQPQLSVASEKESLLLPARKDPALMQKIEGLNAKIRASDVRNDTRSAYNREEQKTRSQVDQKTNSNTGEVDETVGDFVPVSQEVIGPAGEKQMQPMVVVPRRSYHGGQGRVDNRGKGKFNNQDTDGWRRKPLTPEYCSTATASIVESVSHPCFVGDAANNSSICSVGKDEGESVTEAHDLTDIQAQRVKMRELAKQRALQLQMEEEERIKEQKAKALAKLEELNRRTLSGEAADQNAGRTLVTSDIQGEEESRTDGDAVMLHLQSQAPSRNPVSESDITVVDREKTNSKAGKSVEMLAPDEPQTGVFESIASHGPTLPTIENICSDDRKAALQSNEGISSTHKQTVFKHKQNSMLQKSFNEKSVPKFTSETQKDDSGVTAVDLKSMETLSSESRPNDESNVHDTSNTVTVPSTTTTQRKKVNKSSKIKHKADETQAVTALPPVISKMNPQKNSIPESKSTLSNLDTPVSTVMELEASSVFPSEQSQSRSTNNWKPQPVRKTPRNQQANRFTDKAHGSDVIWAPVRAQNKAKDSVEARQKSPMESANLTKSNNVSENSFKGKRAEMERYVPKPVAKELAQQGSIPLLSSSSRSEEVPWMVQFGSVSPESVRSIKAFVESSLETKEGDGRYSNHKKEHGHWQKLGTGPSPISEALKGTQISIEQNQPVKSDNSAIAEINTSGNVDSGGWRDMPNNTTMSEVHKSTSVQDQGSTGKGKRCMPGPRRAGNNPDHENISSSETDGNSIQLAAPDVNHNDRAVATKEHRSTGEQFSHWKPKSHSNSANNQHMHKPGGTETMTTEINKPSKSDHPLQCKLQVPPQHEKESSKTDHSLHDSNVTKESIIGHHHHRGFNREKKHISAKGHSSFPEQDPWESAPVASTGNQRERNVSGYRRNGGKINRYARGHENRGDWPSGQDNRPHNMPASRERQRHNVQYEYQPVGPNKSGSLENPDGPADGAYNAAQRYGYRGQSHSKRG